MPTISDVSIINSNTAEAEPVDSGFERTICSQSLCGSKTLTVYRRTVSEGRRFELQGDDNYHLLYVMEAPKGGVISFNDASHPTEEGAGVLLTPGEAARVGASGSDLELLHMVVPKPPAAVEEGLPGGPGYFFTRATLRALTDASGGRTGLLVEPREVDATCAALDRILGDRKVRRRMSTAARQHVEDYFSQDKYIQRVLAAYQKTIDRSQEKLQRLNVEHV